MARTQSQAFRGGSVSAGESVAAGDIKKLILSYYNEDGITPNQKEYNPVSDSDTVIPISRLRIEDYTGSLLAVYNPLYDDVTIKLPPDGLVLVDDEDSVPKHLEDAVMADELGKLQVYVGEREDSTPEHPNKVLVLDDHLLREDIDNNAQRIENLEEAIAELDVDSVPHAYLHSTLAQSAGDSVTTGTPINVFALTSDLVGDCFEFEQTTTIDDTPFGYVWIEPGTYLINASVTLQWVGDPRGTFVAKVGNVMGENFDFSYEQEIKRNTTKVVTIPSRMKFSVNITYDAGTPVMGFWIQSMQVVKLAGGMSQTTVAHGLTLEGNGSVEDPLDVTTATFGKIKDIAALISTFRNGDVIPVDGPNGPAKMPASELQDAILGGPIDDAVRAWLDDHPEATTTVEDNSITDTKLHPSIKNNWAAAQLAKGHKVLVSTASFFSQITDPDTIYEIRSSFDLGGATVEIPADCILNFVSGTISNGYVKFNNTLLSGNVSITCDWLGTVSNDEIELSWFGAEPGGTFDCTPAFQKAIAYFNNAYLTTGFSKILKIGIGVWGIGSTVNFGSSYTIMLVGDPLNRTEIIPINQMTWMFTSDSNNNNPIAFMHLRFNGVVTSQDGIYDNTKPYQQRFNEDFATKSTGCIYLHNEYYTIFNNVQCRNFSGTAIKFDNFWNVNFRDVMMAYCDVGIALGMPNGIAIHNCEFNTIKSYGVLAYGSYTLDIHDNIFEILGKSAVLISNGGEAITIRDNYFEDCSFNGVDVYDHNNSNILFHATPQITVGTRIVTGGHLISGAPFYGMFSILRNSFQANAVADGTSCGILVGNCAGLHISGNSIDAKDIPLIGFALTNGVNINNVQADNNNSFEMNAQGFKVNSSNWVDVKCYSRDNYGYIGKFEVATTKLYHNEDLSKFVYTFLFSNKAFAQTNDKYNGESVWEVTAPDGGVLVTRPAYSGNYSLPPADLDLSGEEILVSYYVNKGSGWSHRTFLVNGSLSFSCFESYNSGVKFTLPKLYFLSGRKPVTSESAEIKVPTMSLFNTMGITLYAGGRAKITKDADYSYAEMMSNNILKKILNSGIAEYSADIVGAKLGEIAVVTTSPKKLVWYDGASWLDADGTAI